MIYFIYIYIYTISISMYINTISMYTNTYIIYIYIQEVVGEWGLHHGPATSVSFSPGILASQHCHVCQNLAWKGVKDRESPNVVQQKSQCLSQQSSHS